MSIVLGLLLGCAEEDPVEYEQLNSVEDVLEIQVGLLDVTEPLTVDLYSNTGSSVVGTATLDPGGGPVGTLHTLTVVISEPELIDKIDDVRVLADAQGRTNEEFFLTADSADESLYVTELVSVGSEDEQRTDLLYLQVLDLVGDAEGTSSTDTGQ